LARKKSKKKGRSLAYLLQDPLESLPYPYVHYSGHYGVFIGFSEEKNSKIYLCSCARKKVETLFSLRYKFYDGDIVRANTSAIGICPFPRKINEAIRLNPEHPEEAIFYSENLCHMCNQTTPEATYCSSMYGTQFVQQFGWYINQEYYELGMHHSFHSLYLPEVTPKYLVDMVEEYSEASEKSHAAYEKYYNMVLEGYVSEIERKECNRLHEDFKKARKIHQRKVRAFQKEIENRVRLKFGKRKIGERWVRETKLYKIVQDLFPTEEVKRHFRPDWLNGLELDIYMENMRLAIEYQGEQHYKPIEVWGGEAALAELQARDTLKQVICNEKGITLLHIKYDEPLTEMNIRNKIEPLIFDKRDNHSMNQAPVSEEDTG